MISCSFSWWKIPCSTTNSLLMIIRSPKYTAVGFTWHAQWLIKITQQNRGSGLLYWLENCTYNEALGIDGSWSVSLSLISRGNLSCFEQFLSASKLGNRRSMIMRKHYYSPGGLSKYNLQAQEVPGFEHLWQSST